MLFLNPAGAAVAAGRCIGTLIKPGLQGDVIGAVTKWGG